MVTSNRVEKATNAQIEWMIKNLLLGVRLHRSNPNARALVREAILRVRQLRGILEARSLRKTK